MKTPRDQEPSVSSVIKVATGLLIALTDAREVLQATRPVDQDHAHDALAKHTTSRIAPVTKDVRDVAKDDT